MGIKIETVKTQGFSMHYFRFGTGKKTLVILPGLSVQSVMGMADAVAAAYEKLTEQFTIYLFDRRTDLPPVYPVEEMGRDTARAMEVLGLEKVCLFGVSQGGMMALVIAMEYPELVERLVVGSTSSHIREEQFRVIEGWIRLAEKRDGVGLYLDMGRGIYPPGVFESFREALAAAGKTVTEEEFVRFRILAEGIRDFNVTHRLDSIRCPILAIGVFEDGVVDVDATMEIAENLDDRKDFRLYLYTGYGHAAYDTAPDYQERVRRFLLEE